MGDTEKMITPEEAEELAIKHIQEYVNSCRCQSVNDVGNALLKMLSVTGQAIVATQGQAVAVAMVEGTARHLAKPKFSQRYNTAAVN